MARHVESGIGIQCLPASRINHCSEQNFLHKTHTQLTPTHMIGLIVLFFDAFFPHSPNTRASAKCYRGDTFLMRHFLCMLSQDKVEPQS